MPFRLSAEDQQRMISFLQDLVRIPSPSTQEGAVAARIAEEMEEVGFTEVSTDRIGNVIGKVGRGDGARLVYNAHMDTVGIGDPAAWRRAPYGGQIENGILYGRGASDMKSSIAAMVYAARALIQAEVELAGTLYLVCVVQEEPCEGYAMRVLVEEEGLRPDWVVLGEPTGLQVARGQRGRLELEVKVRGRSSHASTPSRGENAIVGAARLIQALEDLAPKLADDPFLGKGTLAVTEIGSVAGSRNVVPDLCYFIIDRRLTWGETLDSARAEIRQAIGRAGVHAEVDLTQYSATSYTGYLCRTPNVFPAWAMPENHPLIQATVRAVEKSLGYTPTVGRWDFSTDGVYTAGVAGIPTVGFGPGDDRYSHTTEDQVRIEDVVSAVKVYARLAADLLGKGER